MLSGERLWADLTFPGKRDFSDDPKLSRVGEMSVESATEGNLIEAGRLTEAMFELAYTLLTFHYVFLRGMRTLGLGLAPADEDAFLHAWTVVGHVLGVRDDLLPASFDDAAASLERMQAFGRAQTAAPEPRPGPTGTPLFLAQRMKSITIRTVSYTHLTLPTSDLV